VACGGDHIFAKSQLDDIYGWGRNDEGQLGVGFLSDKVEAPTLIKDLCYKGVKQICCQDNYSAALSIYGTVYVCGSLSGGKLGLGRGQKRGYQLTFRAIPADVLPEIDYIACGMEHMLAISRMSNEPGGANTGKPSKGKTYAWGKNHRGQLGIGSKENQFSPQVIDNTKERFTKVACGYNFSLGLSSGNRVYFWGNFKYGGNAQTK
jgi:alpha-tubulin suppressor-like RCC1 family protein